MMVSKSILSERGLQHLWATQAFHRSFLIAEDGRRVRVESPGLLNTGGGPDFRGARLVIGTQTIVGDVELHLTSRGWREHGHRHDGAYRGVILHVALRRDGGDRFRESEIPELVLEPYLEGAAIRALRDDGLQRLCLWTGSEIRERIEEMAARRLDERTLQATRLMEALGQEEALYREVMVGLGYPWDKGGFFELARRHPCRSLQGLSAEEIERRLAVSAGSVLWRSRPGRPVNRPRKRIAGIARFLSSRGALTALLAEPEETLKITSGGLIGPSRAHAITITTVLPFRAVREGRAIESEYRARKPVDRDGLFKATAVCLGLSEIVLDEAVSDAWQEFGFHRWIKEVRFGLEAAPARW